MSYRLAPALDQLRDQLNAAYPGRDRRSDGWIGDAAHRSRRSDHNPNADGVVCAIDVDEHDVAGTERVGRELVEALRTARDPRVAYVIYEGRMFSSYPARGVPPWTWRAGKGHTQHVHVSIRQDPDAWDDDRPWDLPGAGRPTSSTSSTTDEGDRPMRQGDKGDAVALVQRALLTFGAKRADSDKLPNGRTWGDARRYGADGDYGSTTAAMVEAYQRAADLEPTGTADGVTVALVLRYLD